jgi:hypothetical protein
MKSIELNDINALTPFVQPGSTEPILVTSDGQTVAAVVPLANVEDLEDLVCSRSAQLDAILQRSQQRLEQEGPIGPDEVRRRLGLVP